MFSATSGSSVATAATVATVAMPQAEKLGYDPRLFSGAIAAGGTLGIMIPPSINLIVYGFLTQSSIPQLFLAGLIPGLALALAFMSMTVIICPIRPNLGGVRRTFPFPQMLLALVDLIPILILFGLIVGSIYLGWATPIEAAAVGVCRCLYHRAGLWRCVLVDADTKSDRHGQDYIDNYVDRDWRVIPELHARLCRAGPRINGVHDRPSANAAQDNLGRCGALRSAGILHRNVVTYARHHSDRCPAGGSSRVRCDLAWYSDDRLD